MRINLESGKESRISITPVRLRAAGAESRPLRSDLPAYDLSFMEPIQQITNTRCRQESRTHLEGASITRKIHEGEEGTRKGRLTKWAH
jgi:hypothetical protein